MTLSRILPVAGVVLLVAGIVLALCAVGLVLLTSWAFLLVGLSEDREREREER
jgi:hypothetical protein